MKHESQSQAEVGTSVVEKCIGQLHDDHTVGGKECRDESDVDFWCFLRQATGLHQYMCVSLLLLGAFAGTVFFSTHRASRISH